MPHPKRANLYHPTRNDALWPRSSLTREALADRIWEHGALHFRTLSWRAIDDPYAVLVSEIMLQQTQVTRVERYWHRWLDAFPTLADLANAPVAQVLELWQGLGYNRRALALKRTAEQVTNASNKVPHLPLTFDELVALPGIGPATAAGVMAFAYQRPAVYVETNVRAVIIHELFPDEDKVPDVDLVPFVSDLAATAGATDPRNWYYALLDWGAALKRSGSNPTRASTTYARQSTFEGSRRQKRAELVRIVLAAPEGVSKADAQAALNAFEAEHGREPVSDELFASLVTDLVREGFLTEDPSGLCVSS